MQLLFVKFFSCPILNADDIMMSEESDFTSSSAFPAAHLVLGGVK